MTTGSHSAHDGGSACSFSQPDRDRIHVLSPIDGLRRCHLELHDAALAAPCLGRDTGAASHAMSTSSLLASRLHALARAHGGRSLPPVHVPRSMLVFHKLLLNTDHSLSWLIAREVPGNNILTGKARRNETGGSPSNPNGSGRRTRNGSYDRPLPTATRQKHHLRGRGGDHCAR